jgi:hypothetical protein
MPMNRAVIAFFVVCAFSFPSVAARAQSDSFPPGPDEALVEKTCSACHDASQVTSQHQTAQQWAETVDTMISQGADVSDSDYDRIVNYLAQNFGMGAPTDSTNAGSASTTNSPNTDNPTTTNSTPADNTTNTSTPATTGSPVPDSPK